MTKSMAKFLLGCLLTVAAAQAMAQELKIARSSDEYPPNEMHVDGKLTGLHIETVEAVAAKLGWKVKWQELPWLRAQKCVEDRECDAITYISPSAEREKWAVFLPGNVLSKVEMHFMVHKADADKTSYKGNVGDYLAERTVVTQSGFNYGPEVAKAKKYEVKNIFTMASLIAEKRNEVAVITLDDFLGLKGKPFFDQLALLNPPVWESKSFIAFAKTPPGTEAGNKFQTAFAEFKKTREYQALLTRFKPNP